MSQLILSWLNDDVRLSRKVTAFERDFANGYLLGELLSKHGLLQNFEETFTNESNLTAKRQNWSIVQEVLQAAPELGVKLTDGQVREMMDEDRGSSLKLLFQLRRTLCSKAIGSVSLPTKGGQSQPRLQKQVKEEPEEQFFDQRLKQLRPIDHRYPYEVHGKHFVDEHTQQLGRAREGELQEIQERRKNVQDFRLAQHEKMQRSQAAKELAKKAGEQHWQGVQEKKFKLLEKDLDFEKEMIRRDQLRIAAVRNHYEQDCGFREGSEDFGIAWFEKNLQRIGIDTSEHSGTDVATIEAATLKELYEKMNDKLPTKAALQIESDKRMAKIRETKRETDIARKERARRQRRVQVEQQATAAAVEAKKREEELQAQQMLEAARRQREEAEAEEKKRRKQAQWEERVAKSVAYKDKFEAESEEAWQKFVEKAREERAIKQKHQITTKFEDAPEEVSSDEEKPVVAAPPERKRGSIAAHMASKDKSMSEAQSVKDDESHSAAPQIEIAPAEELLSCARETVMMDYLFGRGDWTRFMPSEEETVAGLRRALSRLGEDGEAVGVPRLGSVVQWLCKSSPSHTHQALPEVRNQAQLAKDFLPVVALAGNPAGLCSGQSPFAAPLAERLSQEFGFSMIKPGEVVSECMSLAEKPPQEPDWPILARMRELGKEALALRPHGVPHAMLAEMIFRKIELLSAPAPKPVEEEDPKKKKKDKKQEEAPEPVRPNGVLILNFPCEIWQSASWEASLQGSWSTLLKAHDAEENHQARLSTLLAPFWIEDIAAPVLKAEDAEVAEAAEKADFDPSCVPSVRIVRLQYPDEATLQAAILKEVPAEFDAATGAFCQGVDQEIQSSTCAADQAWLFESAQVLSRSFGVPFHNCHDVLVQDGEDGEETVPAAEACFKTIRELVAFWRRPMELPESEPAASDAADEAVADVPVEAEAVPDAKGEEAVPEAEAAPSGADVEAEVAEVAEVAEAAEGENEEPDELFEDVEDLESHQVGDTIVIAEAYETREDFHTLWLQGLSSYLLGIRETLQEVDDLAGSFSKDLVYIQRRFLEFLQRPDDKALVLDEFLRGFPLRRNVAPGSRQADEIQEQLQDLTDKLWVHANHRKQESVEERQRLLTDGFWEEKANAHLQLSYKLQAFELCRFKVAMAVLKWTYTGEKQGMDCFDVSALEEPSPELSSLQELAAWLEESAERAAAAEPTGIELEASTMDHNMEPIREEDSSFLEASVSIEKEGTEKSQLVAAIQAERRALSRKCRSIAAWTFARLEQMRAQYDEIFARMDDWIKDRVREENEAIKETERQLRIGRWEDEENHHTLVRTMTVRRSHTGTIKPAPSSAAGKRRRDVLKVIVPRTLDVNVYAPPKLSVLTEMPTASTRPSSTASQGIGKTSRPSGRPLAPEKWSQEMMWGLLTRLCDLGAAGVCDAEQLLKALLERRHGALGLENEQVIPASWVVRPLAVYHLLCRTLVEPAWGATGIDMTEFFLALAHNENCIAWPTMEALEATRAFLCSEESSLGEEELAMYPDVAVSEELFGQLPLWPPGVCPPEIRRWMFQVLVCFAEAEVRLPPKPGTGEGQGAEAAVTARRIFGYFGLAAAPARAFSQYCRLLLPSSLFAASEEDAQPQVLVKDLWTILYSQKTRPPAMIAPVPDLATFCNNLLDEGKVPEAVPKAKAKAKGKAKQEVEEEVEPPVVPEEATVAFSEEVLLSRQTVMKSLCSHGGLLCRRRGLETLFPSAGSFQLKTAAEAAALKELQSLVPEPEVPEAEEEAAEAS
ncbi:unnamed protein product [Durusdinium trenchii]|uniref:Calponin-homology (CH) domain-containing protein n=1 Tax=Durusdinium trenchii TaxID=1381693 RepID=A0ABP0INT8_9DINO